MEFSEIISPKLGAHLPVGIRERMYGELWRKRQIDVSVRDHDQSFVLKTHPLPYIELQLEVTNRLPKPISIYGANIEIWLGKPVIQFYTTLSDYVHPNETRSSIRLYHFINEAQLELLNPKKDMVPTSATIIATVAARTAFGPVEKTHKTSWIAPKVLPQRG